MEHHEGQPERRHETETETETEETRATRREHIVTLYRIDHPVFNKYVQEHQLHPDDAYALLADVSPDPKTGVQRSDLLEYRIEYAIHDARNTGKRFAVAVFDIDNFKEINTELTHVGADDVLHKVAKLIRGKDELLLGNETSVVRWGGEEFVVLFSGQTLEKAHLAAEHIRQRIAETLSAVRANEKPVTVSGGVAEYQADHHRDWKAVLSEADEQVLLAKSAGKNVIFPKVEEKPAA